MVARFLAASAPSRHFFPYLWHFANFDNVRFRRVNMVGIALYGIASDLLAAILCVRARFGPRADKAIGAIKSRGIADRGSSRLLS